MPKQYTADKVSNMLLRIRFATDSDPVSVVDNSDPENTEKKYYAAVQKLTCKAKNGKMTVPIILKDENGDPLKYYGAAKNIPWTSKEVGQAMKGFNNLNTQIFNDLKALHIEAVNENIS